MAAPGLGLGEADEGDERAGEDPADEADEGGAAEVAEVERGLAADGEDRVGAGDGGEGDVAGGGRGGGGQEHPAGEVLLVRDLEGEDEAGDGGLEDRGDARCGSCDEEDLGVLGVEEPAEPALDRRADSGPGEQGRAFVAERPARAQRGDRGEQLPGDRAEVEAVTLGVEVLDVLVGGGRGGPPPSRRKPNGEDEPQGRDHHLRRERELHDVVEEDIGGQPVERPDDEPGERAGDPGQEQHLARSVREREQAIP